MKVLITGGAGYVGGTIARVLLRRGDTVTILDNFCHSKRSALPAEATLVEGSVGDRALLQRLLSEQHFDGVLHCAALIEAGESMRCPGMYFSNNTAQTLVLLEVMQETGHDRLVFSSTAACYGEPVSTPILEDAKLDPTNPYGESKLLVEKMLRWFHEVHALRYVSLRYFNVAGAAEGYGESHEPESHLIPLVLDVALGRRETIQVFGADYPTKDGTCVRDYIHIADLAEAHLLALHSMDEPGRRIYNVGNGEGFTVREVIDAVRTVTGRPIQVEDRPRRPGDPAVLVASSEKIKGELGWAPKHPELEDIVRSAWAWHQQRYA